MIGQPQNSWYQIDDVHKLDSPALVIYPQRVRENVKTILSMIDEPERLRPHVKTHKTKEVTQLLMQAGITKFKCATIAEAEMLAMAGAPDVLLAYQPVGPKILRFLSLIESYPFTSFSCLVDNQLSAKQMNELFATHGLKVPVYIDLNTGMNRTGTSPGEEAVELFKTCVKLNGISVVGFHWYDGHINNADLLLRTERCHEAFTAVERMIETLLLIGYANVKIIAGGSTTFPIHSKRKNIECSPGTFVYWDKGYLDTCAEQAFLPAALVISRVVSKPDHTKLCLDIGHKSVAAENELSKRIYFLNAPGLRAVSQSEEHLVVEAGEGHSFEIGDVLYGLPFHICPTCALYDRAFIIENNMLAGEWEIVARRRKIEV